MTGTTETPGATPHRQPWVHDLVLCLAAPTQVWSAADGQVRHEGVQGVLHADRRTLCGAVLTVDGEEPTAVAHHSDGGDAHVFVAVARSLGDPGPDPTVRVERRREVEPGLVREQVTLVSTAARPVTTDVVLRVAVDLAHLDAVKAGKAAATLAPTVTGAETGWRDGGLSLGLRAHGAAREVVEGPAGPEVELRWRVQVAPGERVTREVLLPVSDSGAVVTSPSRPATWHSPAVESADRRLAPVLERAVADLRLLRLATADAPEEEFLGAGAPWFLTLFGRDSLWAARMLLPLGTDLAASTLRVLARRQGTVVDAGTAQQPGKILHEVRGAAFSIEADGAHTLPPVYYGTIDATPLWALTLHDAWRWGLPDTDVEPLVPALERALAWLVEHGDADGDHLLEYVDESGHGLSNQGWKDSGDAVRRVDGSLAHAPVALCEVQGYAYAAALRGADLLERFGRGGTDRWREWAGRLREQFRRRFWVEDAVGPFPAIALDGDKRPVVSLTSNIGHLLGTGLLSDGEVDAVARRLVAPDLLSGFGVRTMSSAAAGYSPTGYHVGSVWPHDTAICLAGLAAEGRPEVAPVAEALLGALHAFDGRPPELFAGDPRSVHPAPVPYPAACRPQAWSAAGAVALVEAVLGLRVDVPAGRVTAAPVQPWSLGSTVVDGLRAGGDPLRVAVDDAGAAEVTWR
ncbi:glycogen debranching N-terminal domain-containing protein [Aquipuribacter nitratireducens]|uniref:Glycogen debranching N-terminal domain-containing protein n=1 Tax=Aquipuribacter nitratireducens TaxID=650104 RepID=A0ABW0GQ91_9MICO